MKRRRKGETTARLPLWLSCLLMVLAAVWQGACQTPPQSAPHTNKEIAEPRNTGSGYNFTPQQASNIIGNSMHEAHSTREGIECKDCHRDETVFITHEQALALCKGCHGEQTVALDVWNHHCLSCHQFTKFKERYAESTHVLRELCQDCHGEGSVIYRAFEPDTPHDVTCDNCHHPHKSALAIAGDLCETCHSEIADMITHENRVHGSCLVCHTPHSELPDTETLCGNCHVATSDILMHSVPEHPTDCLACHSPHFETAEIIDEACQVCHSDEYYGGRTGLPDPHRHCESCHHERDFSYMGDQQCAACHPDISELQQLKSLPDEHRDCATCHQAHTWSTEFNTSCVRCHDEEKVIEHSLSFHQAACDDCHDPHHIELMGKSGDCEACHGEDSFPGFRAGLPDAHVQCENCHSKVAVDSRDFGFDGPEKTCMVCHDMPVGEDGPGWSEVPSGHRNCQSCHEAHVFDTEPEEMRCDSCHRSVFEKFPAPEHEDCANCHELGHNAHFLSQEESCGVCHAEILDKTELELKKDCMLCHSQHEFTADREACAACHDDQAKALDTPHGSCDTCHEDHVWTADAEACATCHDGLEGLHESHSFAGCADCHDAHSTIYEPARCMSCHEELPEGHETSGCSMCH